jgi:hypothetical protein
VAALLANRPLCDFSGTCDFDDKGVFIEYTMEDVLKDSGKEAASSAQ